LIWAISGSLKNQGITKSQFWAKSISRKRSYTTENEPALAYAGCGRLHAQQGDAVRARDYLTLALAIFERLGTLGEPEKVSQVLSALSEG